MTLNVMDKNLPSSFRDPSGFLFQRNGVLYRQVNNCYQRNYDHLMSSGFFENCTKAGMLVPHVEIPIANFPGKKDAYKIIRPDELTFISYPYEWSFSQLKDAALLTLELQKKALSYGLSLKDANAYNVQFHRGRAIFIDTLSFEVREKNTPWIAYHQFCKHFFAPLALMSLTDVSLGKLSQIWIDGIPLDVASKLLPRWSWFRWSIALHIHGHAKMQLKHGNIAKTGRPAKNDLHMTTRSLLGLLESLKSAITKFTWEPKGSEWGDYYSNTNYSDEAKSSKKTIIEDFIDNDIQPTSVWDLGANEGVFSRIASERKIFTIAFDIDPVAVERNYRQIRQSKEENLLPLLCDLSSPSPSLGWMCRERMSLPKRGPAHTAMALALIHHIVIGNNVPMSSFADFLCSLCKFLIIEFVPKSDSQVQRLLATREDIFPDYHLAGFEKAFTGYFTTRKKVKVQGSDRVIFLFKNKITLDDKISTRIY